MIAAAWAGQKAIKEVMIFLQGVGVSTSLAVRISRITATRRCRWRGTATCPAPNLIAHAAKTLDVPAALAQCLDERAAAEGVACEAVRASALPAPAQAVPQVPAIYLPPFIKPDGPWLTPCSARVPRPDRLNAFAAVDWDKALGFCDHH